jgi:hypothetical protein
MKMGYQDKGISLSAVVLAFRRPSARRGRRDATALAWPHHSTRRRQTYPHRPDGDRIAACDCDRPARAWPEY